MLQTQTDQQQHNQYAVLEFHTYLRAILTLVFKHCTVSHFIKLHHVGLQLQGPLMLITDQTIMQECTDHPEMQSSDHPICSCGTVRRVAQSNFFQSEQHLTEQPTPHLSTDTQVFAMRTVVYSLNVECVEMKQSQQKYFFSPSITYWRQGRGCLRYLVNIFHKSLDNTVIFTSDVIKWSDDNALISDDQMIMMWYCSDMIRSSDDNAMMITSVWSKGTP